MKRAVKLNYTLGEGPVARWLDGLREGKAVASYCAACGQAQFPPLRICPSCRQPADRWRVLTGGAAVLFRTSGTDGDIAMVHFDGATSATIARAEGLPAGATRCVLAPSTQPAPILAVIAEPKQ